MTARGFSSDHNFSFFRFSVFSFFCFLSLLFVSSYGFCQQEEGFEDELSQIVQEYEGLKDDLAKTQAEYKRLQDEYAGKIKDYAGQSKQLEQLQNSKVALEAKLKELQAQQAGWQPRAGVRRMKRQ